MKYKVIKEFAGIEVDSEISLPAGVVNHMLTRGYVEEIPVSVTPIKFTIEGSKLAGVINNPQNKAIEPKYKRNKK